MKEEIITRLENEGNTIYILEGYENDENEESLLMIIGCKNISANGAEGEDILLNKTEVETLIEKLQFHCSRME